MAVKTFGSERLVSTDINTYLANSGLVYVTQTTFSGVATVSVNNCFNSTYNNYKLLITVHGSGVTNCSLRLRASGVDASGTDYYDRGYYNNAGSITALTSSAANVIFVTNYNTSAAYPGRVAMEVMSPFAASRTVFHTQWTDSFSVLGGDTHSTHATGNQYDGFTLLAASGTITGNIQVYGYRLG